ncbi:Multicopper oxidase with three cupredoxin domains (includes cell division protein FtsP and spore coat protein CotA) [Halogranum amylolyticum]|uniref:Multicopper oxidase with three cupredoxin domains (Includes cell division protein FtsP and spore coat protein CotA) n=1 Tax=Halogranum amylolyticum TaxID=660520 RepID=A0A1H8VII6_9EURY|nr:multicopper oxidase family protein [Halogranum amylolyticum]SEP15246.1 Multicopper oxidase with three cupredoxin domains (includes cell division protein FtsP and spore coat protein CotA) [Halogranum amylolyticum]
MKPSLTRRQALATGAIGLASISGCIGLPTVGDSSGSSRPDSTPLPPDSADKTQTIRATAGEYSPTGESLQTWLYNSQVPGPEIRVSEGSRLRVDVTNDLPDSVETTVHWHGVPVRNPADGVPGITQDPITTGETFSYVFDATPPGTYFYHSHVGLQLERQLLGPLVIEEESPHVDYDRDVIVFFNDYLTTAPKPESEWRNSGRGGSGGGMGGMGGGMMSTWRPPYAGHLVNGQGPNSPPEFTVSEGEQVRFRFINASGATTYRVGIGGHTMRVSHADGRPVDPVEVDSFVFGAGERYDAIVTADEPGTWAIHGIPVDGNEAPARAVLQYDGTEAKTPSEPTFDGRRLQYGNLQARESLEAFSGSPDKRFNLTLSTGSEAGSWVINGQQFPDADSLQIQEGDHVRVQLNNRSAMLHPMHLHGHFFRVGDALKDTVTVPSHMGTVTFDFVADNPGDWLFHCHNAYHLEGGMARVFEYR